jgi:hypothetical protein
MYMRSLMVRLRTAIGDQLFGEAYVGRDVLTKPGLNTGDDVTKWTDADLAFDDLEQNGVTIRERERTSHLGGELQSAA